MPKPPKVELLQIKVPVAMKKAIAAVAKKKLETSTSYCRRHLAAALAEDGVKVEGL